MDDESDLCARLRLWFRLGVATTTFIVVGALLFLLGAPDVVQWPAAVGAGVSGYWWGSGLMRRYGTRGR